MGAPTLEALEAMIEEFLQSCHAKNIKLKGSGSEKGLLSLDLISYFTKIWWSSSLE